MAKFGMFIFSVDVFIDDLFSCPCLHKIKFNRERYNEKLNRLPQK